MRPDAHRVVLVRPWVDAHAGGGCCSGDTRDAIGLDRHAAGAVEHPYATRVLGQAYTRLRRDLPDVDVQIVSSSNTVYLLPSVWRARRVGERLRTTLKRANQATRPGSLLVDGDYVGDVADLGPGGVVDVVRARVS
jgi:hypothetical protein